MKTLVTGASGFIGSHLADRLLNDGHEVTCLVRKSSSLRWLENKPVRIAVGDIRDRDSLTNAVKNTDVIFHVAGSVIARNSEAFMKTNCTGTGNLMESAISDGRNEKKVVYISSIAAAGPTTFDHPLSEEDPSHPINGYGRSKYAGEEAVLSYRDKLHVTIIRPPVVYGPRDRGVLNFLRLVAKGINVKMGYRERYVTVIHVWDLVNAMLLAATKRTENGDLFYVDDGTPVRSWRELQDAAAEILGRRGITIRVPLTFTFLVAAMMEGKQRLTGKKTWINMDKYRELSQRAWLCKGTKICQKLGYSPTVSLDTGLKETISWYREMGWIG